MKACHLGMAALATLLNARLVHAQCDTFSWNNPSPSYPAGVQHGTFRSAAAGADIGFNVYTPPGYSGGTQRFPVLYYLHGIGGDEGTMVANVVRWVDDRVKRGLIRPVILVFANGAGASMYADAGDGRRPVKTAIVRELIRHIDNTFRTQACREQRGVSGFSMGGNGALLFAFQFPDLFGSVVAYAPATFAGWNAFRSRHPGVASCMFSDDENNFAENWVWHWARVNATTIASWLKVRIVVGEMDGLLAPDRALEGELTTLGIPHDFEVVPECAHEHGCLWRPAGDDGVRVHEAAFSSCGLAADAGAPAPSTDAGTRSSDGGPRIPGVDAALAHAPAGSSDGGPRIVHDVDGAGAPESGADTGDTRRPDPPGDDIGSPHRSGCSCQTIGAVTGSGWAPFLGIAWLAIGLRRRTRRNP